MNVKAAPEVRDGLAAGIAEQPINTPADRLLKVRATLFVGRNDFAVQNARRKLQPFGMIPR